MHDDSPGSTEQADWRCSRDVVARHSVSDDQQLVTVLISGYQNARDQRARERDVDPVRLP